MKNNRILRMRTYICILFTAILVIGTSAFVAPAEAKTSDKVSVYVVSKVYIHNWHGKKKTLLKTYTYNTDGLVSKVKSNVTGEYYEYNYDGSGRITRVTMGWHGKPDFVYKHSYDNNGMLALIQCEYASGDNGQDSGGDEITCDSNGRIISIRSFDYKDGVKVYDGWWEKFKYNKKGLRIQDKHNYTETKVKTNKYYYDKKKNLKAKKKSGGTTKVRHTYKKGLIIKTSRPSVYSYKYKKIKVERSLLKTVKAQRWSINNLDLNNAFIEGLE